MTVMIKFARGGRRSINREKSSEMQKLLQNVFMTNEKFVDSASDFSHTFASQDTTSNHPE